MQEVGGEQPRWKLMKLLCRFRKVLRSNEVGVNSFACKHAPMDGFLGALAAHGIGKLHKCLHRSNLSRDIRLACIVMLQVQYTSVQGSVSIIESDKLDNMQHLQGKVS